MNHFMGFDPYMIGEHNQQIDTEIDSLRLQQRLRKSGAECKISVGDGLYGRTGGRASCSKPGRWHRLTKLLEREGMHRSHLR